jgi:hypothetical protein
VPGSGWFHGRAVGRRTRGRRVRLCGRSRPGNKAAPSAVPGMAGSTTRLVPDTLVIGADTSTSEMKG